ncbi:MULTISPECIES: P-type conjugative transfer protein TrbL [Pseudomonas]|uniref:Mating pair formation protein TrbL n=1 Tax=Pseudomonas putida TaxID=303 RepID=A0A379KFF5_PSEPU|nr:MULTISPECIES: P-type conjugative transfer protein TrbL [Pseudomonas]MBM7398597.1 type IV secretion system protein VirB6/type IV secretion system protein TrbL [Pseudomonas sp. M5]RRV44647.1 P-type conjugative transfer protein TrbL [Pseudomonas sp. p106]SUD66695.1 mating pair formation protein TrbL [Pseudomonas putida]HDS1755760.1 P-type conjugative transfer protein TrbL [Pseudomonas putida]
MIGKRRELTLTVLLVAFCLATPTLALAADSQLGSSGIMNEVLVRFHNATEKWLPAIQSAAERLFLALATISMVWTFGMMVMRKAEMGEFFSEFIRFLVVFGFYWWLLKNAMGGLQIADSIVRSLSQLGSEAGKLGSTDLKPSSIVDLGFELYDRTVEATDQLSWREMGRQISMEFMAIAILLVLAIVGINLLVLLASSWFLLYAGVFFLGFGGSRWTSDIATNYYRAVLGVGAQLFAMVLLIAIGKDFIQTFASKISDDVAVQELAVMLVVSVLLLFLVNKIPPMIAALVGGAGSASTGIGNFSAGAAVGAATTAASYMGKGASSMMTGGTNLVGSMQALTSAFKGAQSSVSAGTDISSRVSGMLGGPGSHSGASPGSSSPGGASPLGSVMGTSSSSSGAIAQTAFSAGGEFSPVDQAPALSSSGQSAETAGGTGASSGEGAEGGAAGTAGTVSSRDSSSGGQGGGDAGGQAASGGGSGAKGGKGEGTSSSSSSKIGNAGRIALQMTANLASGTGRVSQSRIDKTLGGRLATEISDSESSRHAAMDTRSASRDFEPDAEVQSFSESKQDKT